MKKLTNEQLERLNIQEFKEATKKPIIIILDNIRSLNNIGSVFRTADAFLIEKIYLCGITACPPHKDIHKTALGATESVDWQYIEDINSLVKELNEQNIENATLLQNFIPEKGKKYALIFGNEVSGVQQSVVSACKNVIEIPQFGTKHSLNISVSAGIVVWDIVAKMIK